MSQSACVYLDEIMRAIKRIKRDIQRIDEQKSSLELHLFHLETQRKNAEEKFHSQNKYDCIVSPPIHAMNNKFTFVSPGREYCIGTYEIPMTEFRQKTCLDFTSWMQDLWTNPKYSQCKNIMERVTKCLQDRWVEIRSYALFIFPISH